MIIENMYGRNGSQVKNQFVITLDDGTQVFQSYKSIIAIRMGGKVILDRHYWCYSATTSRYRAQFLGESTEETRAKIKSGEYVLASLNGGLAGNDHVVVIKSTFSERALELAMEEAENEDK